MFSKTLPFLLEFSAIVFSTILAIMIEIKLFRWCFLLYNYLLFELELEIHQDFVCLLILLLVFVSWILGRTLCHFCYKKFLNSWVPKIEKTWTIFPCIVCLSMNFAGLMQLAECADNSLDLEFRLGPPGTPLERGEASLPNLNELPDILYEQRVLIQDSDFFNVELEQNEMASLINRLPKEELYDVIREDSIRKPLNEFNAEQQARLRDIAINHFSLKNEIIEKMKSLYPNDEWDLTKVIREKFFCGRQKDRESSLEDLKRMLAALNEEGKCASCAQRLKFNITNWNWKE